MSRRTHYVSTQQGATLVDVALAVSIAGILLSIGLATWTGSIRERRVSKVAEEIAALARFAQQSAIADSIGACSYRVVVSGSGAAVRPLPPNVTTLCSPPAAPGAALRVLGGYPGGVTVTSGTVDFLPSGRTGTGTTSISVTAGTSVRRVQIDGATGRVEVTP